MDLQIAFIHTRTFPPIHLFLNYHRTASILKSCDVWLLHDRDVGVKTLFPKQVAFRRSTEEIELETVYKYPKNFRNNFWFSSLVRLSLLARFMNLSNKPTIHVESDVVLAQDFPMKEFSQIPTPFAYPIVSNERGVASTLFVRDREAANFLWQFSKIVVKQNPLASDMQILFELWKRHSELVTRLPSSPSYLYREFTQKQQNIDFSGCFDGHDFGIYIGGTNPWNKRGVSEIRSKIKGSHLVFDYDSIFYDKSRKFVSIHNKGVDTVPLYSLHITSKSPIFFTRRLLAPFLRIWLQCYLRIKKTFHPFVFAIMVIKSLKRKFNRL